MAEWQHILIDSTPSRGEVEALVASTVGTAGSPIEGGTAFLLADVWIGVFESDYVDEPGLRLGNYRWVIDVDGTAQSFWGRRIFDALVAETRWALLWQSNSVQVDARASGSAA